MLVELRTVVMFLQMVSTFLSVNGSGMNTRSLLTNQGYIYDKPDSKKINTESYSKKQLIRNITDLTVAEIYDFHIPKFPKPFSSGVFTCGYRDSPRTRVHEIQWLKDDIVFFSYRPDSELVAHVYPDRDWLHHSLLSHMVERINVKGELRDTHGFNITVLTLRIQNMTESMSGLYKCKLSISVLNMMEGAFAVINSREGEVSVVSNESKMSSPEIVFEERSGFKEGDIIRLLCYIQGSPAPHLQWSYVRKPATSKEDDDTEEIDETTEMTEDMFVEVGRSRQEKHAILLHRNGVETRRVGLWIPCCKDRLLSCSSGSHEERKFVQLLQDGGFWTLRAFKPQSKEKNTTEEPKEETTEEPEEIVEAMPFALDEPWLIGLSVASFIAFLIIFICCCCCCMRCKARRARKRKNKEIRRREIYGNSMERGRSKPLYRRSTKKKAPTPKFSMEKEPLTISP